MWRFLFFSIYYLTYIDYSLSLFYTLYYSMLLLLTLSNSFSPFLFRKDSKSPHLHLVVRINKQEWQRVVTLVYSCSFFLTWGDIVGIFDPHNTPFWFRAGVSKPLRCRGAGDRQEVPEWDWCLLVEWLRTPPQWSILWSVGTLWVLGSGAV